jgi:hypothetical protein
VAVDNLAAANLAAALCQLVSNWINVFHAPRLLSL